MTALLALEQVAIGFGGILAVDALSMDVTRGAVHGLIGPNGSGKTTVLNVVTGTYRLDRGIVRFDGQEIQMLPPHRIASRGIARTFQSVQLFVGLSVLENVMTGLHLKTRAGVLGTMLRIPQAVVEERAARDRARDILCFLGLERYGDAPSTSLPFGLQRLVELARALAADPKLLLLDEPAAGMNTVETAALETVLRRLRDERGLTILLVEHDMRLVMQVCDRITVINFGRKIAESEPREIRESPAVIEAYLGNSAAAHRR